MNTDNEPFSLYDIGPVAYGIKELGEALSCNSKDRVVAKVVNSIRYLNEFLGNANPAPKLTQEEAEWSSSIHTYMRKYMDSMSGSAMYHIVAQDRAKRVWYNFVKALVYRVKNLNADNLSKLTPANIIRKVEEDPTPQTTDDLILLAFLSAWDAKEFSKMVFEIKKWHA